jgi:hypothetical protein
VAQQVLDKLDEALAILPLDLDANDTIRPIVVRANHMHISPLASKRRNGFAARVSSSQCELDSLSSRLFRPQREAQCRPVAPLF